MRTLRAGLIRCALAAGALAPCLGQEMLITARGTVTGDQYTAGPYAAAQVGSAITASFRVPLSGSPVVPDRHVRFTVLPPTFAITIDGVVQPGAPLTPAYFDVKDDLFGLDGLRYSNALDNGEFLEFELTGPPSMLASMNLSLLRDRYVTEDPLYPQMMQITGSGGSLFLHLDEIVIGQEVTFATFCDPLPNTTGLPCVLAGAWKPYVGAEAHLSAQQGPPGTFGYFLVGSSIDPVGAVISQGRLCLEIQAPASLGRYNWVQTDGNSLGVFDSQGVLQNAAGTSTTGWGFDVPTALPFAGVPTVQAGQTWHFQFWYRDAVTGQSFLSDGLSATW